MATRRRHRATRKCADDAAAVATSAQRTRVLCLIHPLHALSHEDRRIPVKREARSRRLRFENKTLNTICQLFAGFERRGMRSNTKVNEKYLGPSPDSIDRPSACRFGAQKATPSCRPRHPATTNAHGSSQPDEVFPKVYEVLARHVVQISTSVIKCSNLGVVNRDHKMATQLSVGTIRGSRISNFNSSQLIVDLVASISITPRSL